MSREMLNLRAAAEHAHVDENELRHVAQRGEITAEKRGDSWFFDHKALDEWAQRNLLAGSKKEISGQHLHMMQARRKDERDSWRVSRLFRPDAVNLALKSKTKGGTIRDMTDLAIATGLVYDDEGLFKELVAREEAAPTAIGMGCAFLHPRYHDPYFFEDTFVAYAKSARPIYFGAPDGEATRHFFLVCSTDHEQHLMILARLAVLAHGTSLLERLDGAADAEEAISILSDCEEELFRS